jgi:hypothetical protein
LRSLIVAARWFAPPPFFEGLLTLRSAQSDFSSRLESAPGRSSAYPDRIFTCKNNTSFRTHHGKYHINFGDLANGLFAV